MMRKPFSLFLILLFTAAQWAMAQPTAYQALRSLAGQRDQSFLNRVVQISGNQGTSQPLIWKILIDDPTARGGVREFEVSEGRVLSERAPLRILGQSGSQFVIALRSLNLDSDGAFTLANKEAKQQMVGFDSANYLLKADDSSGSPVWTVSLLDYTGTTVGVLKISGSSGALVRSEGMVRRNAANPTVWPDNETAGDGGVIGRTGRTLNKAGESTRRGTLRALGSVQEWLTGRRTIDRDVD